MSHSRNRRRSPASSAHACAAAAPVTVRTAPQLKPVTPRKRRRYRTPKQREPHAASASPSATGETAAPGAWLLGGYAVTRRGIWLPRATDNPVLRSHALASVQKLRAQGWELPDLLEPDTAGEDTAAASVTPTPTPTRAHDTPSAMASPHTSLLSVTPVSSSALRGSRTPRSLVGRLRRQHARLGPSWLMQLLAGHNVVCHGLGSKRSLLDRWCNRWLSPRGYAYVTVRAFLPDMSLAQLVDMLLLRVLGGGGGGSLQTKMDNLLNFLSPDRRRAEHVLRHELSTAVVAAGGGGGASGANAALPDVNHTSDLAPGERSSGGTSLLPPPSNGQTGYTLQGVLDDALKDSTWCDVPDNERLFLVIHNLDAPALRTHEAQEFISRLAAVPNIHLLASVDYIFCPWLWDNDMVARFRWIWHYVPTYESYEEEIEMDYAGVLGESEDRRCTGALRVLRSLTSKARSAWLLLARYQVENPDEPGLTLSDFGEQCRAKAYAMDSAALQEITQQLENHTLLARRKRGGRQRYFVPLTQQSIESVMQQLKA